MKNFTVLLLLMLFAFGSYEAKAQRAYEEGDKILMAGISFGSYGYGFGWGASRSVGMVPLYASLEFGVHEYFSVGPYIGYTSYNYDFGAGSYSWNFLSVGAKGSFHYVPIINEAFDFNIDEEKFDFYISLFLGYENRSFSGDDFFGRGYSNEGRLVFAPVTGFKYNFNPQFGVFAELGRGAFGYATIGVSYRF